MAELQEVRSYPGKTAKDCYLGALKALEKTGFQVWKKRDFGWFVIARRMVDGNEVTSNIMASPGSPPTLKINMTAKAMDEPQLRRCTEELIANLQTILS